jgi:hypothetical protein
MISKICTTLLDTFHVLHRRVLQGRAALRCAAAWHDRCEMNTYGGNGRAFTSIN